MKGDFFICGRKKYWNDTKLQIAKEYENGSDQRWKQRDFLSQRKIWHKTKISLQKYWDSNGEWIFKKIECLSSGTVKIRKQDKIAVIEEFRHNLINNIIKSNNGYARQGFYKAAQWDKFGFPFSSGMAVPTQKVSEASAKKGVLQSISRKRNCIDNAILESLFGLLKSKLLNLREFSSIDDFQEQLIKYIDYYNNKRIKHKLKGLSPVQYRVQSSTAA